MFPKSFNRSALGSCIPAAEFATKFLLSKGKTNFSIVEGWVWFPRIYKENDENNWAPHTWIEFPNGRKFDPTKKQWLKWNFDFSKGEVAYVKDKTNKTYTPTEYHSTCQK